MGATRNRLFAHGVLLALLIGFLVPLTGKSGWGRSGWRAVLARYQNGYENTVRVSARDADGHRQTITSNRIHSYFARIAAGALIATSSIPAIASEGRVYAGEIEGGAWIDAQHLVVGHELPIDGGTWRRVESVGIDTAPLDACNLTVEGSTTRPLIHLQENSMQAERTAVSGGD